MAPTSMRKRNAKETNTYSSIICRLFERDSVAHGQEAHGDAAVEMVTRGGVCLVPESSTHSFIRDCLIIEYPVHN